MTERQAGYEADLEEDIEASEKADGDLDKLMAIEERRAYITMIRAINWRYGLPAVLIPAGSEIKVH